MTQPHSTADAGGDDNADSERPSDERDHAQSPDLVRPGVDDAADSDAVADTSAHDADDTTDAATDTAAEIDARSVPVATPVTAPEPDTTGGTAGGMRGSHRRRPLEMLADNLRLRWPIRAKLLLSILLPILVIVLLAGAGIAHLAGNIDSAHTAASAAQRNSDAVDLTSALQAERSAAATILAGNLTSDDAQFGDLTGTTDTAANRLADAINDLGAGSDGEIADAVGAVRRSVDSLAELRDAVEQRDIDNAAAMQRYDSAVEGVLALMDAAPASVTDPELADRLRSAALFARYGEAGAQEEYLLYTAIVSSGFDPGSYREFLGSLREQEAYLAQFRQLASADDRTLVDRRLSQDQLGSVLAAEAAAVGAGESGEIDIEAQDWQNSAAVKSGLIADVAQQLNADTAEAASSERTKQLLYLIGLVLLTLALLVASILIAVRIARSMSRGLAQLRSSALEVAHQSLPEVVERLRDIDASRSSGPKVAKVRATATRVLDQRSEHRPTDEIGDVGHAFNLVHREAIDIAVQQAQLRLSVAATFVNLARRSQLLVDRLIRLIDKLEHSERDPDRLSELFQLDHLVTRMRRNDENLLVLAGAEAGRRWTRTAPLLDVLRAATAEIEQYTRVKIGDVVPVAVAAHAVSDVVHLVAELAENATTFSPPRTDVTVRTRISRGSIVIEITDHGIGMAADQLAELNDRLGTPHAANVQLSRMMGLHVVAKLASRHEIAVSLVSASPQGTVATVTLPATLLQVSEADSDVATDAVPAVTNPDEAEREHPARVVPSPRASSEPGRSSTDAAVGATGGDGASDSASNAHNDEQSTEFVRPTPAEAGPRGHKHWRYGELTEKENATDITLAIFESIESEWFREVPADGEPAADTPDAPATPTSAGGDSEPAPVAEPAAELPAVKRKTKRKSKAKAQREPAAESSQTEPAEVKQAATEPVETEPAAEPVASQPPELEDWSPAATQQPASASDIAVELADPVPDGADPKPAAGRGAAKVSQTYSVPSAQPQAPIRARFPMPSAHSRATGSASVRPEWRSAGDAGWQRAVSAAAPRVGGTTPAGLPKRIPMANYIPGGVRTPAQIAAAAAPLHRSPEAIGAGLASYRSGVERGRQAGKVMDPTQLSSNDPKE